MRISDWSSDVCSSDLFGANDEFVERFDARTAKLGNGYWELRDVTVTSTTGRPEQRRAIRIPTRLTIQNITDSFASPETMSFWELPGFIRILENAGFSAVKHRLYWHALLASPLDRKSTRLNSSH